jgi:hypothetical protein
METLAARQFTEWLLLVAVPLAEQHLLRLLLEL